MLQTLNTIVVGQGMFGKADPYAKLRIGTQEFSTKPNPGGGKNPIWNEEFQFDISNEKEIEIEVMDKEAVGKRSFLMVHFLSLT
jgi:Ca2+-dependent lipid-binding protein